VTNPSMIFRRPRGQGWLVLTDSPPLLGGGYSELANSLLANADLSYQPLCIMGDDGMSEGLENFLFDLQTLLDIELVITRLDEIKDWDTIDPGIVILVGGKSREWVKALNETHMGLLILQGLMDGMLLLSIGTAAASLGSWVFEESEASPSPGLNWLIGSIILFWTAEPAKYEVIRSTLKNQEPLYALGLAGGRMIALGPRGEVQFWGVDRPNLLLGSGWYK